MKKSILIPFLFMGLLAFASCKGTSENKSTTATDTVQAEKPQSGTIHLTRAEFLKKIADYENHSKEWKYLGTGKRLWYSEYSYHLVCADERRTPGQYGSFIQGAIKRIHR